MDEVERGERGLSERCEYLFICTVWWYREGGLELEQLPAALTVEDAWRRVLGDHGAVLLIAVVPTVIQLVADQRAQTQTIPIGAVELALCAARKKGQVEKKKYSLAQLFQTFGSLNRAAFKV